MSKLSDFYWPITKKIKKDIDTIAALLKLENGGEALGVAVELALLFAKAHVKGDTNVIFCTPKVDATIRNNPEFIAALCEEGVVEWLTPFVLAKSKQSNHPTPDTTQP
jgi:hypothetical protein